MIEDSTCGTDENIDARPELLDLVLNVDSTVNSDNLKLIVIMFKFLHLIGHLKCKFSGGGQDDSLELSISQEFVPSEVLNKW